MNFWARGVIATSTIAPALSNRRTSSAALYAAMPPATPTTILAPRSGSAGSRGLRSVRGPSITVATLPWLGARGAGWGPGFSPRMPREARRIRGPWSGQRGAGWGPGFSPRMPREARRIRGLGSGGRGRDRKVPVGRAGGGGARVATRLHDRKLEPGDRAAGCAHGFGRWCWSRCLR